MKNKKKLKSYVLSYPMGEIHAYPDTPDMHDLFREGKPCREQMYYRVIPLIHKDKGEDAHDVYDMLKEARSALFKYPIPTRGDE